MKLEDGREMRVVGHSVGGGKVYVSQIDDHNVSIRGEMPTLILFYKDQPGMIWQVTKILAELKINIAALTCNRNQRGEEAFMIITMDSMPARGVVAEIRKIPDIHEVIAIDRLS
jgi:L-serine dehydratase